MISHMGPHQLLHPIFSSRDVVEVTGKESHLFLWWLALSTFCLTMVVKWPAGDTQTSFLVRAVLLYERSCDVVVIPLLVVGSVAQLGLSGVHSICYKLTGGTSITFGTLHSKQYYWLMFALHESHPKMWNNPGCRWFFIQRIMYTHRPLY